MNKFFLPLLAAGLLTGGNALADNGWGHGRHHWKHQHHAPPAVTYYYPYGYAPVFVYPAPPPVVIRERIVERPAYYYDYGPARYAERPVGGNMVGTTLGAIAGAALGNQVGSGNGRVAATAIGAVVGGTLGGR